MSYVSSTEFNLQLTNKFWSIAISVQIHYYCMAGRQLSSLRRHHFDLPETHFLKGFHFLLLEKKIVSEAIRDMQLNLNS